VTLQMMPIGNEVRVRALEFSREADVREETRARATRADTGWLANAGYGVMFHWTDQSAPQHGAAVPYEVAVDRFDVTRFADLVAVTGAGYVIFSVNHVHPHCPAPLRSWEQVHPGWTTRRDLLGEIARALARIHVPLMLYMSSPVMGRLAAVDAREYLDIHRRILSEMGERYGSLVSGYWLDGWYQGQQEFPGLSLHDLQSAVRAGNPERLVAYNSWVYPVEIPWQDYWAGEVGSLVRLPTQRFPASGAARGLQTHMLMYMDAPWVHSAQNTQMESPRFDDDALITFVRASVASHAAVTLNLGVFQDGTVGDKTLAQVVHLRQAIRGH
jgi:alpha-L-fucosidase